MEMTVKDEWKLVEIWLTNAEKSDPVLRAGLQSVYDTYKKKKYLVAVFESGNCDLYEQTPAPVPAAAKAARSAPVH